MRVYVSLTSEDLHDFRAAVVQQLGRLGHQVVSMEGYTADARGPVEKCLADVACAEVYIGLFAFRYGSIPSGYERSVTEMEFREASERKLHRLIFLVPDDAMWPMPFVDRGEAGIKMDRLRQELKTQDGFTAKFFRDKTELLIVVPQAINGLAPQESAARSRESIPKEVLYEWLKPLSFEAESKKHLAHFTGREWVEAKLDDWIQRQKNSRVFCLLGGPGIGKSAIACHWSHARNDVIAFHHCIHGHTEKTDPKRILFSLAAQIATQTPDYENRLCALRMNELKEIVAGDTRTVFDNLFLKPLGSDFPSPARPQLVLIDGLDEASKGQDNELASLLGEVWGGLPDWLRLVVTCRPEMDVIDYLGSLHPFILNAGSWENLQDIRVFLRRELSDRNASEEMINEIVDKSEGMFLYANLVLDEIRSGRLALEQASEFPEGLTGYYKGWFNRKFPDLEAYQRELHELVSVIIAQRAPLPLSVAAGVLNLGQYELHRRLMKLGVLFPLREESQGNHKETFVTLMHKSLHDWLTEINPATGHPRAGWFAADPELGNRLLAEEGWKVYCAGRLGQHAYFRQTLLDHLSEAHQTERLAAVLLDPALVDTLWTDEFRYEWQRQMTGLRHALSLTKLVGEWVETHGLAGAGTIQDAVVAGKLCALFQEMGAFDEAALLAEGALRVWQANHVTDSPDMVGSLLALGRIHSVRERLDYATASYERALAIAQQAYAQDSQQMADVLYALCVFYTQGKRDYKKATDCLEKCLAIRSRGDAPDLVGMANCINDRAVIYTAEGKAADYIGIYRVALSLFEKASPEGHPEMVSTLLNVAHELRKESKREEALEMLRRAMAMAERVLLPQHEYSCTVRASLSTVLLEMGKYDEALEVMRAHVKEMERFPGPDHSDTAGARVQMCQTLWDAVSLSDSSKRGSYREEIREQCQRIHCAEPATVLGLLQLAEGARRAAEPALHDCFQEAALRICRCNADGPRRDLSDRLSCKCFADILETLVSSKPLSELAPQVLSLWEVSKEQLEHESDCLPRTRKLVVSLISWIGRMRLARDGDVEGVHQAFDLIARIGAETPDTLDNLATLTVSLHHRHHDETSELLCRRLLEESERVLDKDHVQTLTYLENLAFLNMFQGHLEEAEEHFRRALHSRLEAGGCEQSGTLSTLSSLAECLLLRGSADAARKLIRDHAASLPADNAFQSARHMLARGLSGSGMQLKNEFSAFEASKICYELSLEIDPNSAVTHNNMALLQWVCLDNPGEARDHFRESIRLLPSDGTTQGNYGHLLAQTMNLPTEATQHFKEARRLSPNEGGILGNYAALLIQQGELAAAWTVLERSVRLCLPQPDRTMARAFFGAAAVLLLRGGDPSLPLGQLKTLFAHGIDYVPWVITAMLDALERKMPRNSYDLLKAAADAISHKESLVRLEENPAWRDLKAIPLDAQWPPLH